MFQNTIMIPAVHTCDYLHNHGVGFCELQWFQKDPIAVGGTAFQMDGTPIVMKDPTHSPSFVVARDVIHTAVRSGRSYGCPVVGEGNVTLKVMQKNVTTLSIRWQDGYIMLVDRDVVSRWIDETYTIVGANAEDKIIDIDAILTKILAQGEQK